MKITAVIAEYNPFHNGHQCQLEEIRRTQDADYILVLMSGNFVQRGAPAICDKFSRAKMALACGADAVLELPVYWSVSSAENFARGAAALLDTLGCIDSLCFGCENPEIFTESLPLLLQTADLLNNEPSSFQKSIAGYLKEGLNYPAAKTKALKEHLILPGMADTMHGKHPILPGMADAVQEKTEQFLTMLSAPNNLLGFEYVRAIAYFHSPVKAAPIFRKGSAYHEENILNGCPSASSLRRFLLLRDLSFPGGSANTLPQALPVSQAGTRLCNPSADQADTFFNVLSGAMPPEAVRILQEAMHRQPLLSEDDFSALLHFTLLRADPDSLSRYYDCNEHLIRRILKHSKTFFPWTDLCNVLKTKNHTHTRISRCLLHILLGITTDEIDAAKQGGYACYARILGFRDSAKPLLTALKNHASVPLITNIGRIQRKLPENTRQMLSADLHASDIYRCLAASHAAGSCPRAESSGAKKPLPSDYETGVLHFSAENK